MSWLDQVQILEKLNMEILKLAEQMIENLKSSELVSTQEIKEVLLLLREARMNVKTAYDMQMLARTLDGLEGLDTEEEVELELAHLNGTPIEMDEEEEELEEEVLDEFDEEEEDDGY